MTELTREIERFNAIIETIEARCMAVDGPVTPTLKEMREDELAEIWRLLQALRLAALEAERQPVARWERSFLTDAELALIIEDSKRDVLPVGSDIRQLAGEVLRARQAAAPLPLEDKGREPTDDEIDRIAKAINTVNEECGGPRWDHPDDDGRRANKYHLRRQARRAFDAIERGDHLSTTGSEGSSS